MNDKEQLSIPSKSSLFVKILNDVVVVVLTIAFDW
jgi:hypothetical protein